MVSTNVDIKDLKRILFEPQRVMTTYAPSVYMYTFGTLSCGKNF